MSDPAPTPAPVDHQFKVKLPDPSLLALHHQAEALGFHTENALAAVYLKACAHVPANKVWELLAKIEAYHPGATSRRLPRRR